MEKKKKHPEPSPKNKSIVGKFIFTYVVLMGLFLLLIGLEPIKNVLDIDGAYSGMIVRLTAFVLSPFEIVRSVYGSVIQVKQGVALDVKFGCNGLEAVLIYAIAIVSFPAAKWHKIQGVIIGFIGLQMINILRIASLVVCSVYYKQFFHYMHIYVAQGIMIAVALLFFLVWLNYVTEKPIIS